MKRQLDQIIFFLDRSIGKHFVADALSKAGANIEIHDDHFLIDANDDVWLSEVGKKGWMVITKDKRFKNHKLELEAIKTTKVGVFTLTAGQLSGQDMAEIFVKALPVMLDFVAANPTPFMAKITQSAKVIKSDVI